MISEISKKINVGYARYLKRKRLDRYLEPGEVSRAELHSKKVTKLKSTFLRLILLSIVLVLVLPLFVKNLQGFKISFDNSENKNSEEATPTDLIPVMLSPNYFGKDSNDRPYNISAQSAVSVSKEKIVLLNITGKIELQDKSLVSIKSEQGDYFQEKKDLTLSQGVELELDKGYILNTNSAYIDLKENIITGGEKVNVKGVLGDITSNGFIIKNSGDEIQFYGDVDLNAMVNNKKDSL